MYKISKDIIFHEKRQHFFWGRGDFGGSVGKGKQTKFYFRLNNKIQDGRLFKGKSAKLLLSTL
jgi:hypothetical protein